MTLMLSVNRNPEPMFCMVQEGQVFLRDGIYYLKISNDEAAQIGQTGDNTEESKWFRPWEWVNFDIDSEVDKIYPNTSITFD